MITKIYKGIHEELRKFSNEVEEDRKKKLDERVEEVLTNASNNISHALSYMNHKLDENEELVDKTNDKGKPKPNRINDNTINVNWDGLSSIYPKLSKKDDEWTRLISHF